MIKNKCKKEYQKAYREINQDKISKNKKVYYENNKDKIMEIHKVYREANKDKISKTRKAYRENNKDEIAEKHKAYYEVKKKHKLLEEEVKLEKQPKYIMITHNNIIIEGHTLKWIKAKLSELTNNLGANPNEIKVYKVLKLIDKEVIGT